MPEGQVLEFTRVTKRFNNVTAVSDLSVRVEPGVVTGFLGPNGAGKTTTLRMLLGQIRPTSGTATIGGASYAELRHPLRTIGAVLEEAAYRPRRTAARQLLIAAKANGIPTERVDEVLRLVGLHADADTRIGGYSLGMRQRLSVATALLGDPGALVLDEPANGLDPEGIRWMRLLMRRLADEGRTVLVSSHVLSEIEQVADHVVVLSKGRAVYAGSIDELADPSSGAVVVDAEDRDGLAAALRAAGLSFDVLRSGVTVRDSDAAAVGAVAAAAGIALTTLQQRGPSLEEVFLDLVYGRRADSPRLDKDANPVVHAPHAAGDAVLAGDAVPAGDAALAASGVPGAAAGVVVADAVTSDAADATAEVDGEVPGAEATERDVADSGTDVAERAEETTESEATEAEPSEAEQAEAEQAEADQAEADADKAQPTEAGTDEAQPTEAEQAEADADEAQPTEAEPTPFEPAEAEPAEAGQADTEQAEHAEADREPGEAAGEAQETEQADDQPRTDEALSGDAGAEEFASDEVVAGETAVDETTTEETASDETYDDETASDETASGEAATENAGSAHDEAAHDEQPVGEASNEDPADGGPDQVDPDPASDDRADDRADDRHDAPTRRFPLPGDLWAPRAAQGPSPASDDPTPTVLPLATEAVTLPTTTEPSTFTELITGIPAATSDDDGESSEPPVTTSSFQIFSPVLSSDDDDEESVDDADDPRLAAMRTSLSAAASRFFRGPAPDYPYGDAPKPARPEDQSASESDSEHESDGSSDDDATRVIDTVAQGGPAESEQAEGEHHEGEQRHHG